MNFKFYNFNRCLIWMFLLFSPLIVFYPVVFQGYTISQNPYAFEGNKIFGNTDTLAVTDPAASAYQDEPWLVYIKQSLLNGEIPIVNMYNGLGAPFLESLQPGVFYILNPILLFLDTSDPVFFDIFVLIHVYIFLFSLYYLFSLTRIQFYSIYPAYKRALVSQIPFVYSCRFRNDYSDRSRSKY